MAQGREEGRKVITSEKKNNPMKYETIHEAAKNDDLADVERHLQNGVDVDARDKNGFTPLKLAMMKAMFAGELDMAKFLLAHGADVDATMEDGVTYLMMVAGMGKLYMVKFLVAEGANIKARNVDGHTPLMLAEGKGHLDVAEFLKQHGAKE